MLGAQGKAISGLEVNGRRFGRRVRVGLWASFLSLAFATSAAAHEGPTLAEFTPQATVDGVITYSEYGNDCIGPITETVEPGGVQDGYTFRICEANDEKNNYYAFEIDDQTGPLANGDDGLSILFDSAHDGVITPSYPDGCPLPGSEDLITYLGAFGDLFRCGNVFGLDAQSQDGDATADFSPGSGWVYEISHPLDSGDPDDYGLQLHDHVGWCLSYDDGSNPGDAFPGGELQFPDGCRSEAAKTGSAEGFGDVVVIDALDERLEHLLTLVDSCWPCPPRAIESLRAKVNESAAQYEGDDARAAVAALDAFSTRAEDLIRTRELAERTGQQMIGQAKVIIDQIG